MDGPHASQHVPIDGALMAVPMIGEIRPFTGNFAPTGWAMCSGQLLAISANTTLYGILGTAYGGDGVTTFALPDLRGRLALGPGQGPGLTNRARGQAGGEETHTLTVNELPAHGHSLGASTANGSSDAPAAHVMARSPSAIPQYGASPDVTLGPAAVATNGGSGPHNNLQPYLALNFIIALQGTAPVHP